MAWGQVGRFQRGKEIPEDGGVEIAVGLQFFEGQTFGEQFLFQSEDFAGTGGFPLACQFKADGIEIFALMEAQDKSFQGGEAGGRIFGGFRIHAGTGFRKKRSRAMDTRMSGSL